MQIKANVQAKTNAKIKSNPSLIKRWILMTLPIIAAVILLPYLFILLGYFYSTDFHHIPTQIILTMIGIQGLLVFSTPIVTAGVLLARISRQMNEVTRILAKITKHAEPNVFLSDEWVSIEKQSDQIGQAATQIKTLFLKKNKTSTTEAYMFDSSEKATQQNRTYQSLFSVSM